jgi:hypothetical protein
MAFDGSVDALTGSVLAAKTQSPVVLGISGAIEEFAGLNPNAKAYWLGI